MEILCIHTCEVQSRSSFTNWHHHPSSSALAVAATIQSFARKKPGKQKILCIQSSNLLLCPGYCRYNPVLRVGFASPARKRGVPKCFVQNPLPTKICPVFRSNNQPKQEGEDDGWRANDSAGRQSKIRVGSQTRICLRSRMIHNGTLPWTVSHDLHRRMRRGIREPQYYNRPYDSTRESKGPISAALAVTRHSITVRAHSVIWGITYVAHQVYD